jgi:dihydrolipoamide dehydrogenase
MTHYDICIIGCGSSGFAAAMRALDLGKHVCIIENGDVGGAGVRWGALASKTMWELAKDVQIAAKTDRGYQAGDLAVDYAAIRRTVLQAVGEKQHQIRSQIKHFSPARWPGPGSLSFKKGCGRFAEPDRVEIISGKSAEIVSADFFLIATGSRPRHFPHIPVDQQRILDSDGIFNLSKFPRRLMIIGAGIVGCEYAAIFSNFGQTDVTLVDNQDRVIPFEDSDVSEFVSRNLAKIGVQMIHRAELQRIDPLPHGLAVELSLPGGASKRIETDVCLVSIGRVPRLEMLQLEKAGIVPEADGYLSTDENGRILDRIYAAGDVTHLPALVNIAEMEGRYAVKHMYGVNRWPINYRNMSTVMFFHPAVASVGYSERTCRAKKIPYRAAYFSHTLLTRAIAMRATGGFVKIIVSDDRAGKILGMRAGGPQASSTIMSIAMLMDQDKGIGDLLKSIYPHPTMSEGIQECLRLLQGKSVFRPEVFPDQLKIWRWHPNDDPGP